MQYAAVSNESWENADRCSAHDICRECMQQYVEVKILEDGLWNIRCPGVGCRYRLIGQDVEEALTHSRRQDEALEKHARLRNENFAPRLQEMLAAQSSKAEQASTDSSEDFLLAQCQVCPTCSVLVRREGGCTHIACRCGADFCFGCGAPLNDDDDDCVCGERDEEMVEHEDEMGGEGRPSLGFWQQKKKAEATSVTAGVAMGGIEHAEEQTGGGIAPAVPLQALSPDPPVRSCFGGLQDFPVTSVAEEHTVQEAPTLLRTMSLPMCKAPVLMRSKSSPARHA